MFYLDNDAARSGPGTSNLADDGLSFNVPWLLGVPQSNIALPAQ